MWPIGPTPPGDTDAGNLTVLQGNVCFPATTAASGRACHVHDPAVNWAEVRDLNSGPAGTDFVGRRAGAESNLVGAFVLAADDITIGGFHIGGAATAVRGAVAGASYDGITIRDNLIQGTSDSPIVYGFGNGGGAATNWSITDNLIRDIQGDAKTGIVLFNVDGVLIDGNVIEHDDLAFSGRRGINADGLTNATISNNTLALGGGGSVAAP